MTYPSQIQPELFALVGVFLFLALSLVTYLGEKRFPNKFPYLYQIAGLFGLIFLVICRFILPELEESTRLWCCYGYLVAALVNTIGINIYLTVPKRQYKLSRTWSMIVTFPSVSICTFFVVQYVYTQASIGVLIAQITVTVSCAIIAAWAGIFAFQRMFHASPHLMQREVTK